MGVYYCDKDGVTRCCDEVYKVLFDKAASVSTSGWSTLPFIKSQFKSCNETTGDPTHYTVPLGHDH